MSQKGLKRMGGPIRRQSPGEPRLTRYIFREWGWLLFGSLAGVVMNTSVVLPPLILGKAVDSLLAVDKLGANPARLNAVGRFALLYVVVTVIYAAGRTGKRYGFRIMSARLNCALRRDMLQTYLAWPVPRYEQERTGDLMSRAVGDVQVVSEAVQVTVTEVFDTGLMMLSNLIALVLIRPGLTLLAALPIPITIAAAQALGPYIFRRATRVREAASRLNSHLEAMVSGVRVFRLLGREKANQSHYEGLSVELHDTNVNLTLLQGGVIPVYATIASLGVVLVIGLGAARVIRGGWTVGAFTSYLTMFTAMSARALVAARVINRVHVGQAAWKRIRAKFDGALQEGAPLPSEHGPAPAAGVEIEELRFTFPGATEAAIPGLTLHVPAASIVGVTGPVGSGKTALAMALSGMYPYAGRIYVNGRELASLPPDERVQLIGYMGQDDFLFSGTIAENIAFQDVNETDVRALHEAARRAALSDDIEVFAEGYDTHVGEGGFRVSGGQKQRIGLARALYAPKSLIILDDPFSAVDLATERRIIERFRASFDGQTIFLFSHRLAGFTLTDQVLVLNHGAIAEQGTHDELIRAGGTYARIYAAQQWMEEHGHEEGCRLAGCGEQSQTG